MENFNVMDFSNEMSAELFVKSVECGYDSKQFFISLCNSEIGNYYYGKNCFNRWLSADYVMEELKDEILFCGGNTISEVVMYWIGYLIRYWTIHYEDSLSDISVIVDFDSLVSQFQGLHCIDFDEAIIRLKQGNV